MLLTHLYWWYSQHTVSASIMVIPFCVIINELADSHWGRFSYWKWNYLSQTKAASKWAGAETYFPKRVVISQKQQLYNIFHRNLRQWPYLRQMYYFQQGLVFMKHTSDSYHVLGCRTESGRLWRGVRVYISCLVSFLNQSHTKNR